MLWLWLKLDNWPIVAIDDRTFVIEDPDILMAHELQMSFGPINFTTFSNLCIFVPKLHIAHSRIMVKDKICSDATLLLTGREFNIDDRPFG